MEQFYIEFGRLLRKKREECGLSHEKLAGKLGLSRTSITNIEGGNQRISLHHALQLCQFVGINWSDLDSLLRQVHFASFVDSQNKSCATESSHLQIISQSLEFASRIEV